MPQINESVKSKLYYPCQHCGAIAVHDEGPHVLDNGTVLFCNVCDGKTVVSFQPADTANINDAISRQND